MPTEHTPDLTLFLDILHTFNDIGAPYMVIGGFAASTYGLTRATYDIDIVVSLQERHIVKLAESYPLPRYYADPVQMRDSMRQGIMFNIIDTTRGEKADLIPVTMASHYARAFRRRIRRLVKLSGTEPLHIWCARPDDVIIGKLMAWREGRSHKHEIDVHEMLVAHYSNVAPAQSALLDEQYVDAQATALGTDVQVFWQALKESARHQAEGSHKLQ